MRTDLNGLGEDAMEDAFAAVLESLSTREWARWAGLCNLAGACGGCGREPTAADVRAFVGDWLDEPAYREALTDEHASHVGFSLIANGSGRKIALALMGDRP